MLDTILFDLDGTLLPMDQDTFIKVYFQELCQKCSALGYAPDQIVQAVWKGTEAMVRNDGTKLNRDRFWDAFASLLGDQVRQAEERLDRFYSEEFHRTKSATAPTPLAGECVGILKNKGYRLVLATNPLFPPAGVRSRMSWAGIQPEDFDWITHYKNSHYCKPNPAYFGEILDRIGKVPQDCLMVGNDAEEDTAAALLGCRVYLIRNCLENRKGLDIAAYPGGSFEDFRELVRALPPVGNRRA